MAGYMTFHMKRCNFRKVAVPVTGFGNSASSGMAQQTRQGTVDNRLPLRDVGEFLVLHRLLGSTGVHVPAMGLGNLINIGRPSVLPRESVVLKWIIRAIII